MHPHTFILTSTGKEDFWKDAVWLQYTGRKDKNGKEIYFGDILATSNDDPKFDLWSKEDYGYTVCMEDDTVLGVAWSEWSPDDEEEPSVYSLKHCEVIGNIHQHKHLLS